MSMTVVKPTPDAAAIEAVLVKGDLSQLTETQRLAHYRNVCGSLGLNPLTQPFNYIKLSGKLVLYAKRDAAEQLRKLHGVSIVRPDDATTGQRLHRHRQGAGQDGAHGYVDGRGGAGQADGRGARQSSS